MNERRVEPKSCHHKSSCEMYELFVCSGTLKYWQVRYCDGDFESCARFRLAGEGRPIPLALLPDGATVTKQ